jgi:Lar family restriction alleviation protein
MINEVALALGYAWPWIALGTALYLLLLVRGKMMDRTQPMTETDRSSPVSETLKPCPFCGVNDAHVSDTGAEWVICRGCEAEGPVGDTRQEAIEKWNYRFHHAQCSQHWQPIETGPKDGSFILTFTPGCVQDTMAWDETRQAWMNGYDDRPRQPTHWKPLDDGPADTSTVRPHMCAPCTDCGKREPCDYDCPNSSPNCDGK